MKLNQPIPLLNGETLMRQGKPGITDEVPETLGRLLSTAVATSESLKDDPVRATYLALRLANEKEFEASSEDIVSIKEAIKVSKLYSPFVRGVLLYLVEPTDSKIPKEMRDFLSKQLNGKKGD